MFLKKLEKMLKTIDHLNENFTHLRNQSKNTQENDEVLVSSLYMS